MRLAIIGSGIAGLSTAHLLTDLVDVDTTVFERAAVFGGRANVDHNGEHCPRVFLDNYEQMFTLMRRIHHPDGRNVLDTLHRLRRLVRVRRGWIEVSHLYRAFAQEVSMAERFQLAFAARRSRLLAERSFGPNRNRYGGRHNFTLPHALRLARNLMASRTGFAFAGPTDTHLIGPWVRQLEQAGVRLRPHTPVRRIIPSSIGVALDIDTGQEHFDAVVVAAYVPDVIDLLDGSELAHALVDLPDVHCKALTVTLNPNEPILRAAGPAIYCHGGINVVVQPDAGRCVVLCTWSPSTDDAYVLQQLREFFQLQHSPVAVAVRTNQRPDEGVFAADPVDATKILRGNRPRHVFFAGSYLRTGYPLDSGESAARSAHAVVDRLRQQYGLRRQDTPISEARR